MTSKTSRRAALAALPAVLVLATGAPSFADDHGSGYRSDDHSSGDRSGNGGSGHEAGEEGAGDGKAFQIELEPLNDSGAKGMAMLHLEGNRLTVKIESQGLTPGQPHAQHIHGATDGHDFHCPDGSDDKDGDGIVSTTEGVPDYGDINISLTTSGDTSQDSGLAVDRMPAADDRGNLSYERTIAVSQDVAEHIQDLHIVQHGIDPNGNNEYDFGKGKSELDAKLPQEATAPADCGIVEGAAIGSVPVGGVETGTSADDPATGTPSLVAVAGGIALLGAAGVMTAARRRAVRVRTSSSRREGV
ncbi:CHRD domain-containing protein [Streptomyces sp. NPDC051776]|uniref:CHRD domain-containing protein n=1 Tax=Streptomyces sp. NPDC051776 TaxID=3155414 RepID=UPI0034309D23